MQHVTPNDDNSDLEPMSHAGASIEDDAVESGAVAEAKAPAAEVGPVQPEADVEAAAAAEAAITAVGGVSEVTERAESATATSASVFGERAMRCSAPVVGNNGPTVDWPYHY
jgi:hypothetical protein